MEPMSKESYQYEKTIDKQNQYIEKLEQGNSSLKSLNEEQAKTIETMKIEKLNSLKEISELKIRNEIVENNIEETTSECQEHVDDIELQNDQLEAQVNVLKTDNGSLKEQNELLKSKLLPEEEILFYYICKADVIFNKVYSNKRDFTLEELLGLGFPVYLLQDANSEGVRTTNFTLFKQSKNNYSLTKN